jgi:hypothetical protein
VRDRKRKELVGGVVKFIQIVVVSSIVANPVD